MTTLGPRPSDVEHGSRASNACGGRPRHVDEIARPELELLVAQLEAVATFEDEEALFVMAVPMQRLVQ
jgi:hypothetical protein